jgi:7-carboxy-7-deazaguanine synthase (Cx14CxxC type)
VSYAVKELFYTLQGEGMQAGRAAVFCRFAGCNLWSGREIDRPHAQCTFCDTDFVGTDGVGGGRFASAVDLATAIESFWPGSVHPERRLVVMTGGEPMLQLDQALVDALHQCGFSVAIETNGTLPVNVTVDWICVSPKADNILQQRSGNELKLVYPQVGVDPAQFESLAFEHFLLQALDGPSQAVNLQAAVAYCQMHPRWRLSLQQHKVLGLR